MILFGLSALLGVILLITAAPLWLFYVAPLALIPLTLAAIDE